MMLKQQSYLKLPLGSKDKGFWNSLRLFTEAGGCLEHGGENLKLDEVQTMAVL